MEVLSTALVDYLSAMTYRSDAERLESILPLGGIYWADELDFESMKSLSEPDRDAMFRVVALRMKLWDGETLDPEDQAFWDAAQCAVPGWAVFRRLTLSDDDRRAHQHAFSQVVEFFEAMKSEGYEVDLNSKDDKLSFKRRKT